MSPRRLALALGALVWLATSTALAQSLVVIRAKAFTGQAVVENATIVVRDGQIASVAAGAPAPLGLKVVDAQGRWVSVGLMNAGTQLGLVEVASLPETSDGAVKSGPLGPAFDVQAALDANSVLLPQARADGLTRAGDYPGGSATAPFLGQGTALRLSEGPDLVDRPGALMFAEIGGMAAGRAGGSRAAAWSLLRDALDEARRFHDAPRGAAPRDLRLDRPDLEALQPVLAGRTPLALRVSRESDIRQAVRLAEDYRLKLVVFGGAEAWRVADLLAARRIAVVLDPLDDLPTDYDALGTRPDNAARLQRAGVAIAFWVPGIPFSYNPGSALREAAGTAVANGLPWVEAMRAVTVEAARIWGVADHYGTMAPGQDADLVVWDGDPLEPSTAPVMVLIQGRAASLATRQSALRDRYSPRRDRRGWPAAYPDPH